MERLAAGLPDTGQWRNGFDLADVDGDGNLDLIHGPPRKSRRPPVIFRGLGDGRFSAVGPPRFADLPLDYGDAAAADFDGDGRVDLAFAVHLGGVTALLADADGDFPAASPGLELLPPGEADFSSREIEAADWDGDGRIDLIALGEGPARGTAHPRRGLAVFLNRETGWMPVPAPDELSFGDSLALGDLDGDGRMDALIASRRLGDPAVLRLQQKDGSWTVTELETIRPKSYSPAVAVTELDEGKVVEFALSWVQLAGDEWRSGVDLYKKLPQGWQRTELYAEDGAQEIRALVAGDADQDGRRDLVTGNDGGEIRLFLGQPDGSLRAVIDRALAEAGDGCAAYDAHLEDIDADGRPELLLSFANEPRDEECSGGGSLQAWRLSVQ